MQYGYLQSKQKPVVLGAVHRPLFCAWESGAVCLSAPSCPSWLPPDPFCLSLPSAQGSTFTLTCLLTCTACSISEIPGPFSRMTVLLLPQDLCTLHKLFHVFSVSSSIPQPGQIRELTHFLPVHMGVHAHTHTQQFWNKTCIYGEILICQEPHYTLLTKWRRDPNSLSLSRRHGPEMKELGPVYLTWIFLSLVKLTEKNIKVLIVLERSMGRHKAFCSLLRE